MKRNVNTVSNSFFSLYDSPEQYDEAYDKWMRLTLQEQAALIVPKSRIYVSVADIERIQNAFEIVLQTADRLVGGLNKQDERRIMQMGYALEEIKHKLQKRIAKSDVKNQASSTEG